MTRQSSADVLPTVAVHTDVLEADGRIGVDPVAASARALGESKVFTQVSVFIAVGHDHGEIEGDDRTAEPPVANGKVLLPLHVDVDLAVDHEEATRGVEDLDQLSGLAKDNPFLAGQEVRCEVFLDLLRVDASHNGQVVRSK